MKRTFLMMWITSVMFLAMAVALSGDGEAATLTVDDDGPADHATITSAVENASDGDTIDVAPGYYKENVVINKILTIQGYGWDTTVIDGNQSGAGIMVHSDWTNISGFTVTNTSSTYGNGIGIYINNADNCTIENNNVTEAYYGIRITGDDCNVIQNYIYSNRETGLTAYGGGHRILDNILDGNGYENYGEGMWVMASDSLVEGNYIRDSGEHGIMSGGDHPGLVIRDNLLVDNQDVGIYISNGEWIVVEDNYISGHYYGLAMVYYSMDNVVRNNTLVDNGFGIATTQSAEAGYPSRNVIRDNTLINCSYVALELDATTTNSQENKIINNTFRDMPHSGGIRVYTSHHNLFKDNHFDMVEEGFYFLWSDNNTITGNDLSHISTETAYPTAATIILFDSSSNVVSDNFLTMGDQPGVYLWTGSTNNTIVNNSILCHKTGIRADATSSGNVLYGNNLIGNTLSAADNGTNDWNSTTQPRGNYWDDYTGVDADSNGTGDTPYNVSGTPGNQDLYPLMEPTIAIPPPPAPALSGPTGDDDDGEY